MGWKIFFDLFLILALVFVLILNFLKIFSANTGNILMIFFAAIGFVPVIQSAIRAILNRKLTIDLLAAISLVFTFFTGHWSSAVFINLMLASARVFSNLTQLRAKNTIEKLLKFKPSKVKIKKDDKIIEIQLEEVAQGDLVVVDAGDRIAVDGIVVSGQASVDQSILTGESDLIIKKPGDRVFSSTLNEAGSLLVQTEKIGKDTTLSKIIALVSEASSEKSKIHTTADKFTNWYIFFTIIGTIIIFLISRNLYLVLSILLVTCADDIAVAVPLAFTAGIVVAAKEGIIIKGADIIERLNKIDIFITDKTGTLTFGKPKIEEIFTFGGHTRKEFLELLALAEINSNHPLGKAIIKFVKEEKIKISAPDEFNEVMGEGMKVLKDGKIIFAGRPDFLKQNKIKISKTHKETIEKLKEKGRTIIALGFENKIIGFVVLRDEVRPFAKFVIEKTRKLGVKKWIMLTGDNEKIAKIVADELQMDEYKANMTPQEKLNFVRNLKKENNFLAMIGDGVNDAASLALADVSFAMGAIGSDAAIESADIALMNDRLKSIPAVIRISRKTLNAAKQDFWIWGIVNVCGLFLVFTGFLNPVGAAFYNFATDFIPIFNSLRIFRIKSK